MNEELKKYVNAYIDGKWIEVRERKLGRWSNWYTVNEISEFEDYGNYDNTEFRIKMKDIIAEPVDKEVPCYDHPDAPHGFNRNASHDEDHYVCECKGWFEENVDDAIYSLESLKEKMELLGIEKSIIEDTAEHNAYWKMRDEIYKQIKFMRGLMK